METDTGRHIYSVVHLIGPGLTKRGQLAEHMHACLHSLLRALDCAWNVPRAMTALAMDWNFKSKKKKPNK